MKGALDAHTLLARATDRLQQGWCQGAPARNEHGTACDPDDPHAVAWCATGALREAVIHLYNVQPESERAPKVVLKYYVDLLRAVQQAAVDHDAPVGEVEPSFAALFYMLMRLNDHPEQTQERMVALFERAAALIKEPEPCPSISPRLLARAEPRPAL